MLIMMVMVALVGCKTAGVYDPVKTDQVKAGVKSVVTTSVYLFLHSNTNTAAKNASYLRIVGGVFCEMSETSQFTPTQLTRAINDATFEQQAGIDPAIIAIKNAAVGIFEFFYATRFRAELSPEAWPKNVADVICQGVDQGLLDAGLPGVKTREAARAKTTKFLWWSWNK